MDYIHRILLVDDENAMHDIYQRVITEVFDNCLVDSVFDGKNGLAKVQQSIVEKTPYSLAIVDMRMPGWDGLKTIQLFWEKDPDIQIVLCTAYSDYSWEEVNNILGQGGDFLILKKPYNNIELAQLIANQTKKWELNRFFQKEMELKESELLETSKLVNIAQQSKKDFLAMISHELRTPLNGILGMTSLLTDTKLNSNQKDIVETILNSGENLLTIVNDILDFSNIRLGKLKIEERPCDLKKNTEELAETLASTIEKKDLKIIFEYDKTVPRYVLGDLGRIRQVLINLANNAIKFTEKGFIKISIRAKYIVDDKAIFTFTVEDTGMGIPKEKIDLIFDEFYQINSSTTREYGGLGLGLSVCKQIVDKLNGSIVVSNRREGGAKFEVSFPLKLVSPKSFVSMEIKKAKNNIITSNDNESLTVQYKVLVVENDLVNQKVARKLIEKMNNHVDVAVNGQRAIDMFREEDYDFIFMDLFMPVMGGFEATAEIRKIKKVNRPLIPIIAMTAEAGEGVMENCLVSGMNDYITKPISAVILEKMFVKWGNRKNN